MGENNKNRGSSFLYVLIALSFITFTCSNFLLFEFERMEIFKVNNLKKNKYDKNKLIELEKISASNLFEREDEYNKYFVANFVEEFEEEEKNKMKYIFMCESYHKISVGGYKVVDIVINNKKNDNNCLEEFNDNVNAVITYEKKLFDNLFVIYREKIQIEKIKNEKNIYVKVLKSEVVIDEKDE